MQLLEWQSLIFLLPIVAGALYLILMALGLSWGEHGAGGDLGHDVGLDHGADVDHGADLDHGTDVDHGVDAHPGALAGIASFLGVGKVPLAILGMSYCFVWGAAGLASLTWLGPQAVWTAVALALAAAVFVTRHLAAGIARLVPSVETYSTPARALVGLRGEVLYEVTDRSGVVRVCDPENTLHDVAGRISAGGAPLGAGTTVVLKRYDAAAGFFYVDVEESALARGSQ